MKAVDDKPVLYTFQCNHCFIISGSMSRDPDDAPTCCYGERMLAVAVTTKAATHRPQEESR